MLSERRLQYILNFVPVVIYTLRAAANGLKTEWVSANVSGVLGYTVEEAMQPGWWRSHLHPDDRDAAMARNAELTGQGRLVHEYRFRHRDGHYLWVRDELVPLPATADKPREIVGAWVLITKRREAEQALQEHRHFSEQMLEAVPNPLFYKDEKGRYLGCNQAFATYMGLPKDKIIGHTVFEVAPKDLADVYFAADNALFASGGIQIYETSISGSGGKRRDVIFNKATFSKTDGSLGGLVGVVQDITERKQAENRLRLAANALENTAEGIVISDAATRILSVNKAFCVITGYGEREIIGKTPQILKSGRHDEAFYGEMWKTLRKVGHWRGEIWNRRKNGEIYPQWLSISAVRDDAGVVSHYVGVFSDISKFKQYEQRLEFLAHHDALTHLPNRTLFQERLREAILRAHRHHSQVGLLFIDLDGFKTVNDSLGHAVGDTLLKAVAKRLDECIRESDTVARLGGDEFIVLLDELADSQAAGHMAQKLLDTFQESFTIAKQELFISASIGVSCYPADGGDVQTLLKNADAAMYRAKAEGRNTYQFFSVEMNAQAFETLIMGNSLRMALERDEFVLNYQPRIDLSSGQITGVEALVRWQHPDLGLIPPGKFIPLAEQTGMIVPMGEWVLRTACRQLKSWQEQGLPPLRMAVNLSARQFAHPELAQHIAAILEEAGVDAGCLEVEITESMVMQNPENTQRILSQLKATGIAVAIDDFGTGYSSLSYLKRFPIDCLKIDQSFTSGIPSDPDDVAITKAIIAMAKSLKLRVVAEGVETEEHRSFLKEEGCEEGQGHLFSRACHAGEIEALLSCTRPWLKGSGQADE